MSTQTISKSIFLAADPTKVWDHLTKSELLEKWFHPSEADLAEGEEYTLLAERGGDRMCWGKVEAMDPVTYMRWAFTVKPLNGHMTHVEWRLAPVNGGTNLTLEHSGLPDGAEGFGLVLALDEGWHGFVAALQKLAKDL